MLTGVSGLRVLLTNCWLENRAGTELYVRDVALGLLRAGHQPMVWSPLLGEVAAEISAAGVPVMAELRRGLPEPDVLHCQHGDETLAALSRFPDRPGLYVQHDAQAWQDTPPLHARLRRYLAVDELCLQRLLASGVDPARTAVVPNSVDLDRFCVRDPLPARPRRALVFGNTAREETFLPSVRAACERMGIELDVAGLGSGKSSHRPEQLLRDYDLVFAKARAALEAVAVGCAVVVLDVIGIAGMVTEENLPEWRRWNLGRGLLTAAHDVNRLVLEIERYDPADASRCATYVRDNCGLDAMIATLLAEYDGVAKDWDVNGSADPRAELIEVSERLALIGPLRLKSDRLVEVEKDWAPLVTEVPTLRAAAAAAELRIEQAKAQTTAALSDVGDLAEALRSAVADRDAAGAERDHLSQVLADVGNSTTYRLRAALLRSPAGPMLRRIARWLADRVGAGVGR